MEPNAKRQKLRQTTSLNQPVLAQPEEYNLCALIFLFYVFQTLQVLFAK